MLVYDLISSYFIIISLFLFNLLILVGQLYIKSVVKTTFL